MANAALRMPEPVFDPTIFLCHDHGAKFDKVSGEAKEAEGVLDSDEETAKDSEEVPKLPTKSRARNITSLENELAMRNCKDLQIEPELQHAEAAPWPASIAPTLDHGWSWYGRSLRTILEEEDVQTGSAQGTSD